jgi:hypothetical protein
MNGIKQFGRLTIFVAESLLSGHKESLLRLRRHSTCFVSSSTTRSPYTADFRPSTVTLLAVLSFAQTPQNPEFRPGNNVIDGAMPFISNAFFDFGETQVEHLLV